MSVQNLDEATIAAMPSKQREKHLVARNIYSRMLAKGFTQADLARRASVGTDSLSVWINARSMPGDENLQKLAAALDCDVAELRPAAAPPPPFSLVQDPTNPLVATLAVNTRVPFAIAGQIMALLAEGQAQMPGLTGAAREERQRKRA